MTPGAPGKFPLGTPQDPVSVGRGGRTQAWVRRPRSSIGIPGRDGISARPQPPARGLGLSQLTPDPPPPRRALGLCFPPGDPAPRQLRPEKREAGSVPSISQLPLAGPVSQLWGHRGGGEGDRMGSRAGEAAGDEPPCIPGPPVVCFQVGLMGSRSVGSWILFKNGAGGGRQEAEPTPRRDPSLHADNEVSIWTGFPGGLW